MFRRRRRRQEGRLQDSRHRYAMAGRQNSVSPEEGSRHAGAPRQGLSENFDHADPLETFLFKHLGLDLESMDGRARFSETGGAPPAPFAGRGFQNPMYQALKRKQDRCRESQAFAAPAPWPDSIEPAARIICRPPHRLTMARRPRTMRPQTSRRWIVCHRALSTCASLLGLLVLKPALVCCTPCWSPRGAATTRCRPRPPRHRRPRGQHRSVAGFLVRHTRGGFSQRTHRPRDD